ILEDTSDKQGGEHRNQNSDREGYRKAFDRPGSITHQNDRGEQSRQVAVYDGRKRLAISTIDRRGGKPSFSAVDLFANSVENDHIGVDRHTNRKDDTRDTR